MAERSGVSRNMLQQIGTGRTNPSIATLARISATLGVGDALRMRGDRPHAYANPGPESARLTITVVYSGDRDRRYLP